MLCYDDVGLSNIRPLYNQLTSSYLVALYRYLESPWWRVLTLCKYSIRESTKQNDTQLLMVLQQDNYDEKGCNLYPFPVHVN